MRSSRRIREACRDLYVYCFDDINCDLRLCFTVHHNYSSLPRRAEWPTLLLSLASEPKTPLAWTFVRSTAFILVKTSRTTSLRHSYISIRWNVSIAAHAFRYAR